MINQAALIKIIDVLSFIALITMISSGTLLKFTLPPRSGGASVWGLTRHEWGEVHLYLAVSFLVLMTVHLVMHLRFIKSALLGRATREQGYRIAIGVVSLILLIALAFAPAVSTVDESGHRPQGRQYQMK